MGVPSIAFESIAAAAPCSEADTTDPHKAPLLILRTMALMNGLPKDAARIEIISDGVIVAPFSFLIPVVKRDFTHHASRFTLQKW